MSRVSKDWPKGAEESENPSLPGSVADGWGSDRIVRLLRELESPYLCFNPGASFRGLHDSLVNCLGNRDPKMLLCLHEENAVAIAHGYPKVAGKPLAVALGPARRYDELLAVACVLEGAEVVVDVHVAPGYAPSTVAALAPDGKAARALRSSGTGATENVHFAFC